MRSITEGVKGLRPAEAARRETPRGKGKLEGIAFSDPKNMKSLRSIKQYLCQGLKSPCRNCEVMCGYGRRWLEIQREGIKAC